MKFFSFISIAFLFVVSTASAQSKFGPSGGSSGSSDPGRMERSMPNLPPQLHGQLPPGLKGALPESVSWDASIAKAGNNPDGMTVNCFAEDSDNLFIGGDFRTFDTVMAGYIVQYNRKTGQWISLDTGFDNDVYSLAIHNGVLYAAGAFNQTYHGGTVLNYIAEWNGASWQSVGGGMSDYVNSIAFIGDTLYAGGNFNKAGGNPAKFLAYWDGQNWYQAFGGTTGTVRTLLSSHDSLFVSGNFNYVDRPISSDPGYLAYGMAMLQNGNWMTFGDGFIANSLAFYHDTLWAGGGFYGNGHNDAIVNQMAFWNGSSWQAVTKDTNIGTNGTGDVNQLITVGDTLIALGSFSSIGGAEANGIAMYRNGSWSSLAGGLYGYGVAAIPFNGMLYVGGRYTKAGATQAMGIASLSNGKWTSLARLRYENVGWQTDQVTAIATTSGYVFIGGDFETIAGKTCNHVAAYNKLNDKWLVLDSGVDGNVSSIAVLNDTLYVGGSFNHAGSVAARHIAKYNITTGEWSAMGNGSVRPPEAIATDGRFVYSAIYNPLVKGTFYDYLGQWDGTQWNAFGNGLNAGYIYALAWQGSTLYAAGSFVRSDSGTAVNYIAEIQSGGLWSPLNTGLNNPAFALAVSGDSLYVGGDFTEADGQVDSALAVWNNTSQEWNPIAASGCDGTVYALAADGNGGVYAGGDFSEVAQVNRGNLVHWDGSAFGTVESGVNNTVEALATDSSALYAGGWFTEAGSSTNISLHFGALDGDGVDAVSTSTAMNNPSESIYPNPVINAATVDITLAESGPIKLELFNSIGERVGLLADGPFAQGNQSFSLNSKGLPDGLYFLRLTTGGVVATQSVAIEK